MTTKQAKYTNMNRNPTGKGGFQERPQDRSDGRWDKNNSQSYWIKYFDNISAVEFDNYLTTHKLEEMSNAQHRAYIWVKNSKKDFNAYREITNRSEGMPPQAIDHTTKGEKITPIYGGISAIQDNDSNEEDICAQEKN